MQAISKALQFMSKTDQDAIIHCSDFTKKTQSSLGLLVLFTGTLAAFSGGYAVFTAFYNYVVAVAVGFLYGGLIMAFDREIVSSRTKFAVFARLPLALVVGLVVSVPLEIRLFQERLDTQIKIDTQAANQANYDQFISVQEAWDGRAQRLETEIEGYRTKLAEAVQARVDETTGMVRAGVTGIAGQGPAYEERVRQEGMMQQQIQQAEQRLSRLNQQREQAIQAAREVAAQREIPSTHDLLARYEALGRVKAQSVSAAAIAWGLRLLLVVIEMFPAFLKLTLPKNTDYNMILEAKATESIERIVLITNHQMRQFQQNPHQPATPTLYEALAQHPLTR
jgi:hypothetical protein